MHTAMCVRRPTCMYVHERMYLSVRRIFVLVFVKAWVVHVAVMVVVSAQLLFIEKQRTRVAALWSPAFRMFPCLPLGFLFLLVTETSRQQLAGLAHFRLRYPRHSPSCPIARSSSSCTYCAVGAAVVVVAAAQTKKSNQPPRRRRTSEQFIISGSVPSGSTVSETRSRIGGRAALRPTKLQCEVVGKEAPRKRLAQNEAEIKTEREIERKKGSEKKRD